MSDLGWIYRPADRRIAAAWGEFDNLSGAGKPLVLDDRRVPEDLRVAYRLLKMPATCRERWRCGTK